MHCWHREEDYQDKGQRSADCQLSTEIHALCYASSVVSSSGENVGAAGNQAPSLDEGVSLLK